jgi:hypothetical protein
MDFSLFILYLQYLLGLQLSVVVVGTKIDCVPLNQRKSHFDAIIKQLDIPRDTFVPFSAVTGEGQKSVWHAIAIGLVDKGNPNELIPKISEVGELFDE